MMDNNGMMYGAGPAPTTGGYNYQGVNQPMQKHGNVLSDEEIDSLQRKQQQFSLAITNEEYLRAVCNHRTKDGSRDTLTTDPETGRVTCAICGYQFTPVEPNITLDQIKDDVNVMIDILQTIKLMYIDLPKDAAKDFFPIIALLEKVPKLFDFAVKNMQKHEVYNWQYSNRNMGAFNMFNNLQNMFSGAGFMPQNSGYMGQPQPNGYQFGGYQHPMMGGGYPNEQPMMNHPNSGNPFGFNGASMDGVPPMPNPVFNGGMPNQGYTPETNGFKFAPGQQNAQAPAQGQAPQAAPAASSAPKPDGNATVTQSVSV